MEIYKGYEIEKSDFGFYSATNINDCDGYMKFAKTIEQLKIDIDEEYI